MESIHQTSIRATKTK